VSTQQSQLKLSIRSSLLLLTAVVTLITASFTIGLQYYFSKNLATQSAFSLYELSADNTSDYIASLDTKALNASKILSQHSDLTANNWIKPQTRELFAQIMLNNPVIYAIYVGFDNGDFYELINLDSAPIVRNQYGALPEDRWIVVTIKEHNGQRLRHYNFLNHDFKRRTVTEQQSSFYATKRPWYNNAKAQQTLKSEPYLFQLLKTPGQTYSTRLADGKAVLGIDIALTSISDYLLQQQINDIGQVYLSKNSGEIIASNTMPYQLDPVADIEPLELSSAQQKFVANSPLISITNATDAAPLDFVIAGQPKGYAVDIISVIAKMTGLQFQYINGFSSEQLAEKFKHNDIDMRQAVYHTHDNERDGILSSSFANLAFTIFTKPAVPDVTRLEMLAGRRLGIVKGWSITNSLQQNFPRVNIVELESRQEVLHAVRSGTVYAGLDVEVIVKNLAQQFFISDIKYHNNLTFLPLSFPNTLHFLSQHHNQELAQLIDFAIANISPNKLLALQEKWLSTNNSVKNKITNGIIPYPELINPHTTIQPNSSPLTTTVNNVDYVIFSKNILLHPQNTSLFSIVIPLDRITANSLREAKFSVMIALAILIFLLPVAWFAAKPFTNYFNKINTENARLIHHQQDQQDLLQAFTGIISQAIDDKSSSTAQHCKRVPQLAMMLVDCASKSEQAEFADFSFTKNERREFSIAAALHDCGKLTTPDHIINKATKLEGVYNRIHEIRMRFEVLWRDLEIEYLTELSQKPLNYVLLQQRLQQQRASLVDDFEFIANVNLGCDFMPHRDIIRLRALANVTWQRNFDDTLGLSIAETTPLTPRSLDFPVTEHLLMDKPEHLVRRQQPLEFDPKHNIKMKIPEYLYNNGELYNLSVTRGTLTTEERFKINEHIISTIKMLETLPLPPELAKIPRYASTHHETLRGSGYPRSLTAEQLSIPDRVMAIADRFAALTSSKSPYKEPKSLSVAIDMLYNMALGNQIDMDIFQLLLTSGIYWQFGELFLEPEQMDQVNIIKYLEQPANATI